MGLERDFEIMKDALKWSTNIHMHVLWKYYLVDTNIKGESKSNMNISIRNPNIENLPGSAK